MLVFGLEETRPHGALRWFGDLPELGARHAYVAGWPETMAKRVDRWTQTIAKTPRLEERYGVQLEAARSALATFSTLLDRWKNTADELAFRDVVAARLDLETLAEQLDAALLPSFEAMLGEAPLPGGARLRLIAQTGHSARVRAISFAPDGAQLITLSDDGRIIAWDSASGRELYTWWAQEMTRAEVTAVALGPDGLLVIGDARGELHRREPTKASPPRSGGQAAIASLAFSPDGSRLAVLSETLAFWTNDTLTRELHKFDGPVAAASARAKLGAGGDRVALADGKKIAVYDFAGKLHLEIEAAGDVESVAISGDGRTIAALLDEDQACIWSSAGAPGPVRWTIAKAKIIGLTGRGDSLVTDQLEAWNLIENPPSKRANFSPPASEPITALAIAGSLLVTGTASGTLSASNPAPVWSVPALNLRIGELTYSSDGTALTATGPDGMSYLWDLTRGRLTAAVKDGAQPKRRESTVELHSGAAGQIIRRRSDKAAVGYFAPHDGAALERVEISPRRALLVDARSAAFLADISPRPNEWLFEPKSLWKAKIAGPSAIDIAPDGRHIAAGSTDGVITFTDAQTGSRLGQTLALPDGRWAVADDDCRFDSSNGGAAAGLHWVLDQEPIELAQLKAAYFDPFLLAKKLGANSEPLRDVVKWPPHLFPLARVRLEESAKKTLHITLRDRGGGIGPTRVAINGKEAFLCRVDGDVVHVDVLEQPARREADTVEFSIDLTGHRFLRAEGGDEISVITSSADERLTSRDFVTEAHPTGVPAPDPHLWIIVAGTSKYADSTLALRYAAKDAIDIGTALALGGEVLFPKRVHLRVLSTDKPDALPSRAAIHAAFVEAQKAASSDILVVYFAGHGAKLGNAGDHDFHYLTHEAFAEGLENPALRGNITISGDDLTEWLKLCPALKQVLILDTCHSGQVIADLTQARDVPSSHIRAIERMKDRTGLFVLAGSAADKVSFEASRFAQGLLTHALLFGMRGAALRDPGLVDVEKLFTVAVEEVPKLAAGVGGVQRPMVAVPFGGATFDIGALSAADRERIPIGMERPIFVSTIAVEKSSFIDELELAPRIDEALEEIASTGRDAPFVFVQTRSMPGANGITGGYVDDAGAVRFEGRLVRDKKETRRFEVEGTRDDLAELARKIIAAARDGG